MPHPETVGSESEPIGPVLFRNLTRLGYAKVVLKMADISRTIADKTGESYSTARIAHLVNAVRLEKATIAKFAESLGVSLSDLLSSTPPSYDSDFSAVKPSPEVDTIPDQFDYHRFLTDIGLRDINNP